MNRKTEDKYLGHILHEDWLTASVAATMKDRTGRFKGATCEVRAIIKDFTLQTQGGMDVAKISWSEFFSCPSCMAPAADYVSTRGQRNSVMSSCTYTGE